MKLSRQRDWDGWSDEGRSVVDVELELEMEMHASAERGENTSSISRATMDTTQLGIAAQCRCRCPVAGWEVIVRDKALRKRYKSVGRPCRKRRNQSSANPGKGSSRFQVGLENWNWNWNVLGVESWLVIGDQLMPALGLGERGEAGGCPLRWTVPGSIGH